MKVTSLPNRALIRAKRLLDRRTDRIEAVIRLFGSSHPNAFFIQIGANDGHARDPLEFQIERRAWRGIMVEPVPYVFAMLYERYGHHPRISLEQSAIADRDELLPFFHLRQAAPGEGVWRWYHTLGSFNREVVLSHRYLIPDIEDRLVETRVAGLTFSSLCDKYSVDEVDLLLLDTEGYDYEILRTLDLSVRRPRLIVYEHYHLSDNDRAAARNLLAAERYLTFEHGLDTAGLDTARLQPTDRQLLDFFAQIQDEPARQ